MPVRDRSRPPPRAAAGIRQTPRILGQTWPRFCHVAGLLGRARYASESYALRNWPEMSGWRRFPRPSFAAIRAPRLRKASGASLWLRFRYVDHSLARAQGIIAATRLQERRGMFPLIEISGPARERGQQHGVQAKARIERSITTYARLFAYCGIDWQGAQRLGSAYRDLVGDLDPALLAAIEGIAPGAGRHVDEILALNARTEILPPSYPGEAHPDQSGISAANAQQGMPDWGECTAVAVKPARSSTGTTLLAQNWDWIGAQRAAL